MNPLSRVLFHFFIFIVFFIIACDLQSSLWLQFFGYSPAPLLWLVVFSYWGLYRRLRESIIILYTFSFILSSLTTSNFGILCFNLHCILFFVYFIKSRIYWEGPLYFMIVVALCATIYPLLHSLSDKLLLNHQWIQPDGFSWIMNVLLTMLASLPSYQFFNWIDSKIRITNKKSLEQGYL